MVESAARQGFPSRTSTGTDTLLGGGRDTISKLWSCLCRLHLYLLFWNQILTWVGVSLSTPARWSLSGADRYLCCLKRRSSSYTCAWEKRTRGFLRLRVLGRSESSGFMSNTGTVGGLNSSDYTRQKDMDENISMSEIL